MEAANNKLILDPDLLQIPNRQQIIEWVRQWSGSTVDAVLESQTHIYSIAKIEGFIAYRISHGCAVVFGEPICAVNDREILTKSFHQFMVSKNRRIIYLIVTQEFAQWAINNVCKALFQFGDELYLNPQSDPSKTSGSNSRLIRKKIKHAALEGVTVQEYFPHHIALENAIDAVSQQWLKKHRGHLHISALSLFNHRIGKRWFYAKVQNKIVGVVVLNQIKAKQGWFLNNLLVIPEAPHGTSELLVITVVKTLAKESSHYVNLGMVPNSNPGKFIGLNKFSSGLIHMTFRFAHYLGHLEGLNVFWSKFNPIKSPGYILLSRKSFGLRELLAIKNVSYDVK